MSKYMLLSRWNAGDPSQTAWEETFPGSKTGHACSFFIPGDVFAATTISLSSRAASVISGCSTTADITATPAAPAAITPPHFPADSPDSNEGKCDRPADFPEA